MLLASQTGTPSEMAQIIGNVGVPVAILIGAAGMLWFALRRLLPVFVENLKTHNLLVLGAVDGLKAFGSEQKAQTEEMRAQTEESRLQTQELRQLREDFRQSRSA